MTKEVSQPPKPSQHINLSIISAIKLHPRAKKKKKERKEKKEKREKERRKKGALPDS